MPSSRFFDDPALLGPRVVRRIDRADGSFLLEHPDALEPYARCVGDWLERWAAETPDRVAFVHARHGPAAAPGASPSSAWPRLTWGGLRAQVGSVAQALLDLALPEGRPVVVLSDNGLEALVLTLAAQHIGRPSCMVSSGYTRLAGGDFTRLHAILDRLDPALVFGSGAAAVAPALAGRARGTLQVYAEGADGMPGALPFDHLLATRETAHVRRAFEALTPDTPAKLLLTSGSTGHPKVVVNTHRMLCANQQMLAQTLRFLDREKPVLVDWLPWSHTFGGNHNLHLVMAHGGTMVIDDGRPMPGAIDSTIATLREVQPTVYFNVPRGYDMLLPTLEDDEAFARRFFGALRMLFYAGSGMPSSTWKRLEAAAARVRDEPLWMTTSWGSTETAPACTFANWALDRPGVIGLPLPGVSIKCVPGGDRFELRVKGEHLFPGYQDDAAATEAAFDDEGYYRIGDAGHLLDPADPASGIVFDGRVAEDFKLTSGTWVHVGALRLRLVTALAPVAQDAVVTGHDRAEVGALLFLSEAGRALEPTALAAHLRAGLQALRAEGGGSSQTPTRLLCLAGPPNAAAGEITDKGYLNQRLTLARRADEVELLHRDAPHPRVVRL